MWTCAYCNETIDDDTWEECWKCSTPRSVSPAGAQAIKENVEQLRKRFHACLRCDTRLRYAGTREFQEGTLRGAFDFLLTKESYVTYICPRCGKVEFYIDGIGNELRGDPIGEADETDDVPEQIGSDGSDGSDGSVGSVGSDGSVGSIG